MIYNPLPETPSSWSHFGLSIGEWLNSRDASETRTLILPDIAIPDGWESNSPNWKTVDRVLDIIVQQRSSLVISLDSKVFTRGPGGGSRSRQALCGSEREVHLRLMRILTVENAAYRKICRPQIVFKSKLYICQWARHLNVSMTLISAAETLTLSGTSTRTYKIPNFPPGSAVSRSVRLFATLWQNLQLDDGGTCRDTFALSISALTIPSLIFPQYIVSSMQFFNLILPTLQEHYARTSVGIQAMSANSIPMIATSSSLQRYSP